MALIDQVNELIATNTDLVSAAETLNSSITNVDNTSDTNKPVSIAQAAAIAARLPLADNTPDIYKPVSQNQQTALDLKANSSQVLTDVPYGALFTDTIIPYTHPALHDIAEIDGLQVALNLKASQSQVLTNVPIGALFTDTEFTTRLEYAPGTAILTFVDEEGVSTNVDLSHHIDDSNLATLTSGSMDSATGVVTFFRDDNSTFTIDLSSLSTYQDKAAIDALNINAATVSGFTVGTIVPLGALFTDTTYTVGDGGLSAISFTTAKNLKLDNIEANAKDDQTKSEIDSLGIDASTVNGFNVNKTVPSDAVFTDTVVSYVLPQSVVQSSQPGALHPTDAITITPHVSGGNVIRLVRGDNSYEEVLIPDTDTVFVHNTTEDISYITGLQGALDAKQPNLISNVGGNVGGTLKTVNGLNLLGSGNLSIINDSTTAVVKEYEERNEFRTDNTSENSVDDTTVLRGSGAFRWAAIYDLTDAATVEPDDDETCFTAADGTGQWLLGEPCFDLIAAHALVEKSFRNDHDEDEAARIAAYLTTQGLI